MRSIVPAPKKKIPRAKQYTLNSPLYSPCVYLATKLTFHVHFSCHVGSLSCAICNVHFHISDCDCGWFRFKKVMQTCQLQRCLKSQGTGPASNGTTDKFNVVMFSGSNFDTFTTTFPPSIQRSVLMILCWPCSSATRHPITSLAKGGPRRSWICWLSDAKCWPPTSKVNVNPKFAKLPLQSGLMPWNWSKPIWTSLPFGHLPSEVPEVCLHPTNSPEIWRLESRLDDHVQLEMFDKWLSNFSLFPSMKKHPKSL